ncbi:putative bifunctional diguanylate cyclase/phosphodiesterase [Alkalibacillus haloalkaliphilus]|uniref:Putative signaling protein n=1 Tax=Alkalibacillus haloalkaliphilus TaxID=94136 RepID=A0A511W5S6_9BACI|nr:EAL domain-containing protein [Alkalibacillus haloalkaliphilus]GEN46111.1 putative signaling protein [Alkalibacillus haloalkaliphilus]
MDIHDYNLLITISVKGSHDSSLVVLSVLIAIFASYGALTLNERLYHNGLIHPYYWIVLASLTMGLGIWSMHFIGMTAYHVQAPMSYDWILTILSVIPAIVAAFIAFWFAYEQKKGPIQLIIASSVMGIGIATMHYSGMEAIVVEEGSIVYNYIGVVFSVLVALFISFIALYILINQPEKMKVRNKVVIASLLGIGVASMHYTGMMATYFDLEESMAHMNHSGHDSIEVLVISVTVSVISIVLFSIASTSFDRQLEKRLEHYDHLTNLPNRKMFDQKLEGLERSNDVGLAIVHLHALDTINYKYSYQTGDETIKVLVEQIKSAYRSNFSRRELLVYRISNKKIAVIVNELDPKYKLEIFSKDLISSCKTNMNYGLNISIGLSCKPTTTTSTNNLMEQAYAVLSANGDQLIGQYAMYTDSLHREGLTDRLVERLRLIDYDQELIVKYQPKIANHTFELSGVEVLIRWQDDELGFIPPNHFIPVAEETGAIHPITLWLIEHVCKQMNQWKEYGIDVGKVAINLSNRTLSEKAFALDVKKIIEKYNVDPHELEFEMTESSIIEDEENALNTIQALRELGVSTALDDFGTGFSSLTYLKRLPIDQVKIDKSFLEGITEDVVGQQFLRDIINLGNTLSLGVVVEGIENSEHLEVIKDTSASEIQGFYFAKPMSSEELLKWYEQYYISNLFNKV